MTFLNPLLLFGLATAAIPLILHLLNLRKLRTIEFSTLTFLKELQRTSIRRLKLRQILLLIIRTALIAFIVLAFARPALRGSILGTIGTHARSSVFILLDNSFSMTTRDERGELFVQAKESARDILDLMKEGDEAFLFRTSDLTHSTMDEPTHDAAVLKKMIDESTLSYTSVSMADALRLCAKLMAKTHNANKEVYILSDFQRTLFENVLATQRRSNDTQKESLFPPQTKFFFLSLGGSQTANATVDSVAVVSRIIEKGKPVNVTARIRNYGAVPLHDYVVSLYLDGTAVAQRNVDVAPWSSVSVDFTAIPKHSGFLRGSVAIESDAVEQDNVRHFVTAIPEKVKLLFVSPSRADVSFLSLALSSSLDDIVPNPVASGLFDLRYTTPKEFSLVDLKPVDVVVCANLSGLDNSSAERLSSFADQGGGLIFFPGDGMDRPSYDRLFTSLNIPTFEEKLGDTGNATVFQNVDIDHPLFSGMYKPSGTNKPGSVESPDVFIHMKRHAGRQGRSVISLNDQTPFLSEYHSGSGIVFVFASAPILSWSDFPLKGMFAPLIHRTVLYAATQSDQPLPYAVGDELSIKLRRVGEQALNRIAQYTLRLPDGTEEILRPENLSAAYGSSLVFSGLSVNLPGTFEIRQGTNSITAFAVNVMPQESDLRKISDDDLQNVFASLGIEHEQISRISPDSEMQKVVLQSRYGVELWKFCLGTALILALAEMAVARDGRKSLAQFLSPSKG